MYVTSQSKYWSVMLSVKCTCQYRFCNLGKVVYTLANSHENHKDIFFIFVFTSLHFRVYIKNTSTKTNTNI